MVKVIFLKGKAIELEKYSKQGQYYDGLIMPVLKRAEFRITKDFDNFFVIVGGVGTGKTKFAFTLMDYMLKGQISLKNIGIGEHGCLKKLVEAKQNDIILLDDASGLFMSSEHNKTAQKKAIKILHLCRDKNLTIFLTAPDLFRLNPYLILDRTTAVIKTYLTPDTLQRGNFVLYGTAKVKSLYLNGKKQGRFPEYPEPDIFGKFTDFKIDFEQAYKQKKQRALDLLLNDKTITHKADMKPIIMDMLRNNLKLSSPVSLKALSGVFDVSDRTLFYYRDEIKSKNHANSPETTRKSEE